MEKDYSVLYNYVNRNANRRGCRVTKLELIAYCIGYYGFVDSDMFDKISEMHIEGLIDY